MVAEVTVKCGTSQHSEIFSLYLRVNHAQFIDNAFKWDSACSNIFCLAFIVPQSVVRTIVYALHLLTSFIYCLKISRSAFVYFMSPSLPFIDSLMLVL